MRWKKLLLTTALVAVSGCGGGGGGSEGNQASQADKWFEVLAFDLRDPATKQSLWTGYHCSGPAPAFHAIPREKYPEVFKPYRHYILYVGQKYEIYAKVWSIKRVMVDIGSMTSVWVNPGTTEIVIQCEILPFYSDPYMYKTLYYKCERDDATWLDASYRSFTISFKDPPGYGESWNEVWMGNDGKVYRMISREDANVQSAGVVTFDIPKDKIAFHPYVSEISINVRYTPTGNRNTCPPYYMPVGSW